MTAGRPGEEGVWGQKAQGFVMVQMVVGEVKGKVRVTQVSGLRELVLVSLTETSNPEGG